MPTSPSSSSSAKPEVKKNSTDRQPPSASSQPDLGKKKEKERQKEGRKLPARRPKSRVLFPYFHLCTGLLITGALAYGLMYASAKMNEISKALEQNMSRLVAMQDTQMGNLSLEKRYQSVREEAEIIARAFPNEETIIEFFKLFRRLVGTARVESFNFASDQPLGDQNNRPYIDFEVEVVGTQQEVETFLTRIDQLPYLIEYQLVDVHYPRPDEAEVVVRARLHVDYVFYLTEND